jgi:hypothetical protein
MVNSIGREWDQGKDHANEQPFSNTLLASH